MTGLDAVVGYLTLTTWERTMRFFVVSPHRAWLAHVQAAQPQVHPPSPTSHHLKSLPISNLYDALFPFTGYNSEQTLKLDKPT